MKLSIVGVTGLVGQEVMNVLETRHFEVSELIPVASERSWGGKVRFRGNDLEIQSLEQAVSKKPDFAIFSAGSTVSLQWAPRFEEAGTVVIDNSSAWRMSPRHKLIVPEVNAHVLKIDDRIIANPNCSTIQMVLALAPLHVEYKVKRIIVSTYQSVSGTGKSAVEQLFQEREGKEVNRVYPHSIDLNVIPHIDEFQNNGYTREEMKMVNETRKILGDDTINITATCVRIPVIGGHSEAVNVEFSRNFKIKDVIKILNETSGIVVEDDIENNRYPMPVTSQHKDEVFVGRIRRDESQRNTLNLWIVADNLRKGAATNAIQIAEYMVEYNLAY